MKPPFRLLVLIVLRRLLARNLEDGDEELVLQLDDAIEEEELEAEGEDR